MTYVITQNCCKDASCVPVCPVECIRPIADTGSFTGTEMLYIDPAVCIDCGACEEECPVGAIYPEEDLPPEQSRFLEINARYFQRHPLAPDDTAHHSPRSSIKAGSLRVAIVGAGPAGCYAAAELVATQGVEISIFERLPVPYGLVRYGVAPDHQKTKDITRLFGLTLESNSLRCYFNVNAGSDITHAELMGHHHAVIYAVGASKSRRLGIQGESLTGHHAAADFVGWYHGHPDHVGRSFDVAEERAVIIGNGNVSLDVARVLLAPSEILAATDIADHALRALAESAVTEVVILARRGPRHAAFSIGEFLALCSLPDVDVIVEADDFAPDPHDDIETVMKLEIMHEVAERSPTAGNKRIVLRFFTSPEEILGDDRVQGLRVATPAGGSEILETCLVLRSTGYLGSEIAGVPFDAAAGTIPNDRGRVTDQSGTPVPGVYATGWIKRGPRGVIGTNRHCAEQTVARLWEDLDSGALSRDIGDRAEFDAILAARGLTPLTWSDWVAIDEAERRRGERSSRPRVKFVGVSEMLAAAQDA